MTFDLGQILTSWIVVGIVFYLAGHAVGAQDPAFMAWLQFHVPVAYGLLHDAAVCPQGLVCAPPSPSPSPLP